MKRTRLAMAGAAVVLGCVAAGLYFPSPARPARAAEPPPSSYAPVVSRESFADVAKRMSAAKAEVMQRQLDLLAERYDLSDQPADGATMSRGKPIQSGVRVKLPAGTSWEKLAELHPADVRRQGLWPKGFLPLPHPNHPEGGMLFPKFHIDEINKQEQRDLTRFDLDFDLPDAFLPEFPPPIYLTTRRFGGRFPRQAGDHRQLLRTV